MHHSYPCPYSHSPYSQEKVRSPGCTSSPDVGGDAFVEALEALCLPYLCGGTADATVLGAVYSSTQLRGSQAACVGDCDRYRGVSQVANFACVGDWDMYRDVSHMIWVMYRDESHMAWVGLGL